MLFLFFTLLNLTWASAEPSCRAKAPMPAELTPESLRSWLAGYGHLIRDPGDFICCLPAEYRRANLITIHSSIALQNGTPESPRIILSPPPIADLYGEYGTDKNVMAFTINGGGPNMSQRDAVEIMNYQTKGGAFELYDLRKDPSDVFMISEPNPTACMRCHGESSGRVPKAGPRPLFDEAPWHRIVGSMMKCNPEQDKLQYLKSKKALEAIRDNPRFACLDKSSILEALKIFNNGFDNLPKDAFRSQNNSLFSFDFMLSTANMRRVVKTVLESPNYKAYKYIIAGTEFCKVENNLEKWMPQKILAQHTNLHFLAPGSSAIQNVSDLELRRNQLRSEAWALRRKQGVEALEKNKTYSEPIVPGASVYSCLNSEDIRTTEALEDQALKIKNPILRAYTLDRVPPATPFSNKNRGISGIFRFLFEARGIQISNWSRDLGRGQYQEIGNLSPLIRHFATSDAELNDLFKPLEAYKSTNSNKPSKHYKKELDQLENATCKKLQMASFEALLKIPATSSAAELQKRTEGAVR